MKETPFKMGSGRTEGGALLNVPLSAASITSRKKEDKNYFNEKDSFSHRNFISYF